MPSRKRWKPKDFQILGPLVLIQQPDEVWTWTVGEPMGVKWSVGQQRRSLLVRKGQKTDLASVPLWARSVVGRSGPQTKGAVVHDAIYRDPKYMGLTRRQADAVLLGLSRHEGMGRCRSWIMWAAVRACGWWAWRRRSKA